MRHYNKVKIKEIKMLKVEEAGIKKALDNMLIKEVLPCIARLDKWRKDSLNCDYRF